MTFCVDPTGALGRLGSVPECFPSPLAPRSWHVTYGHCDDRSFEDVLVAAASSIMQRAGAGGFKVERLVGIGESQQVAACRAARLAPHSEILVKLN